MEHATQKLEFLEAKHSVKILLGLLEKPRTIRELIDDLQIPSHTLYRTLSILLDHEVIEVDEEPKFPRRKTIKLTPKGQKVAKTLQQLAKQI